MKALIWIFCILLYAVVVALFQSAGLTLGAIPTMLLAAVVFFGAPYLCKKWDASKARKNEQQPKEKPREMMEYLRSVLGFVVVCALSYLSRRLISFLFFRQCLYHGYYAFDVMDTFWVNVMLFIIMLVLLAAISRFTAMASSFIGYMARGADGRMYVGGIVCGVLVILEAVWHFSMCQIMGVLHFDILFHDELTLCTLVKFVSRVYFGFVMAWCSAHARVSDQMAKNRIMEAYFGPLMH